MNKYLTVLFIALQLSVGFAQSKPNVIIILTDDQGYGDIRSHGNRMIDTPNMDRIANEGARFENFFVAPLCAPTRASLLTGRYHIRTGTVNVSNGYEIMRSEEVTIAEVFKENGYVTGCFGKWHNGEHYPNNANGQGFDEFIGFSAGHWGNYFDAELEHNAGVIKTEGYITDVLTDKAINWITENSDRQFLCYIPYNAPHTPYQVPDMYFEKYNEKGYYIKTATVYGMVENIDDNLGRLLAALKELQIDENTILIFLTDNGPNGKYRYNGGMKGHKTQVDEGGVRVPFFLRWPNVLENGKVVYELSAHIDILPTLMDFCSISYSKPIEFDGVSLKPLLNDTAGQSNDRTIFSHKFTGSELNPEIGTARTKQYRYVLKEDEESLYDMINDPGQEVNIKNTDIENFNMLKAAYHDWFLDVSKGWKMETRIPVGYSEYPITNLQAVEAKIEGSLSFHGHGWAHDWIIDWVTPEDSIMWELNIVEKGQYEIVLRYVCPEEDLGSLIKVSIGKQTIQKTIEEEFNSSIFPSHDRAPRNGELEKPWKDLSLGNLTLSQGDTQLILSADSLSGSQVMEVRGIRITRLD